MSECSHHHHHHHHAHEHGFSLKGLAFVLSFTTLGVSIGELMSLSGARQRAAENAVQVVVQKDGVNAVLGRTIAYDSKSDTLGIFRKAGTVTVGTEIDGFHRNSNGTITYDLHLRDNMNGHSTGDQSLLSLSDDGDAKPFGRVTVKSQNGDARNLAKLAY